MSDTNPSAPLLTVTRLSYSYDSIPALREVSISLKAGELVALLGPNGSGKSTLIKGVLGHLRTAGAIAWAGRPLADWRRRELARTVGYLPQSPSYDPEQTVGEVLRLGRAPYWGAFGIESQREVDVVRRVAGELLLTDWLDRRMDELSGGQRQRVFLGRCLVQEPRALLLDEPNTFLDLRYQVEMCRLLRKLATEQGIAVLMASHDVNLAAAYADRLVLLGEGRIAAEGTPAVVIVAETLSRVYGLPLTVTQTDKGPVVVPEV